ncbi:MAG: hypothetical protein AB1779_12345, partial [Candidatus Thermoplasmatota archaeon]
IKIFLQANDNLSGIKGTYYKIWKNGIEEPKNLSVGNETNIEEDGKWLIKYYSVDKAENIEEIKTKVLWIDTIAPDKPKLNIRTKGNSIILFWDETNEENFDRYEIQISMKEDFSDIKIIKINDKKIANYTLNLTAGKKYYIKLKVIDLAGWENESDPKKIIIAKEEVNFLFIFIPLILTLSIFGAYYLIRRTRGIVSISKEEEFAVEEVFLIYHNGILISHTTRRLKADLDELAFTGMLTAIQIFIKDSLGREEAEELRSMEYGGKKIIFERGKYIVIAVVISGKESKVFIDELKSAVKNIEAEYGAILPEWSGNVEELSGARKFLKELGIKKIVEEVEEKIKAEVELSSDLEFYQGYIRLKIAAKNDSGAVITSAILKIIYNEDALRFDHIEPKYNMEGKDIILGIIEPKEKKTVAIYLDPKICMESYIDSTLTYKDYKGNLEIAKMRRKKASVVCPIMYTDENINVPMLKRMIDEELEQRDSKIFTMPNLKYEKVSQIAKRAIQRHDVRLVREFFEKEPYLSEAWYFGKTKERKDKLV